MAYKLIISEHADKLLDQLIFHLIYRLKNEQAAKHLLDEMDKVYDRLEENLRQFHLSGDRYLAKKGYREAVVSQMNYVVVFDINGDCVDILGVFHQLENYRGKL